MKKCLIIVNPISGTGSKEKLVEKVRRSLLAADIQPEVVTTTGPGHGALLARQAAREGYLGVIAAGGDGTVNEIASALIGTDTALGIIPLGSGNGLARHLDIGVDVYEAIKVICAKNITPCDYGEVNGQPFFCTFGLGFDAQVSERFARSRHRGLINYLRSAIKEYVHFRPEEYEIIANGQTIRLKAFVIAVCNASQYGNNAMIAPGASIRDGYLDITIIHAGTPLSRILVGVDLFTGNLNRNMIIETMRVKEAVIRRRPGIAHIDGDPIEMPATLKFVCRPQSLLLFTKKNNPPFRPFITPLRYFNRELRARLRRLLLPR